MFNLVVLTGRLTANPELKTTPSGVAVTSFTIANETGFGENKKTHFINIVAWKSSAEFVAKYFKKGSAIGIEGSLQTRKWQDKNGNNRTAYEVVASNVQFIESKSAANENGSDTEDIENGFVAVDDDDDDLPF